MRQGKCNRCGSCCKFSTLYNQSSFLTRLFLRKKIGKKKIKEMLEKDFACPYLTFINNKATCKIYHQRPQFCREYPATKDDLIKNCGFKFN